MILSDDELRARVQRGAKLLDQARPGWADAVNPDHIVMWSCDKCVLGRLFGAYSDGVQTLFPSLGFFSRTPADYGFNLPTETGFCVIEEYSRLARAWRDAVLERTRGTTP